jgi:hypothetical protein
MPPGCGRRLFLGKLSPEMRSSFQAAVSLVAINAPQLRGWLARKRAGTSHKGLFTKENDLQLCLGDVDLPRKGPSGGACAALSAAMVLVRSKLRHPLTAVTGTIDLRGRVGAVDGLLGKAHVCMEAGFELLVVPKRNYDDLVQKGFAGWPDELKELAQEAIKPAANLIDLLELTIDGRFGLTRESECPERSCILIERDFSWLPWQASSGQRGWRRRWTGHTWVWGGASGLWRETGMGCWSSSAAGWAPRRRGTRT